ncbi:uncharacterized protein LOC115956836 [Quercus lobata]|uniref:uncharacterized protein LOC115956836 n=1 Tax=Quercus lobata TaxID=97700 RepID=UPI0012456D1C|nr:uncharacterized protein LOC115956836 [Quercus lobata]
MTGECSGKPLVVVPLAIEVPLELECSFELGVGCKESVDGNNLSQWVTNWIKAFIKSVGTSLEGFEEHITGLLLAIEARKKNKKLKAVDDQMKHGSCGASGGVLLMWDTRVVNKVEEAVGRFSVSCRFTSVSDQFVWAFTGVYGPNSVRDRRFLWEELFGLNSWWNVPWCVGGDFNVVRFPFERSGSTSFTAAMWEFSNFIFEQGLIDIPLQGGSFTWSNTREVASKRGMRPFRFENLWLEDEGFVERVQSWWESYNVLGAPSFVLANKLKLLKNDLKKWNVEVFGNVEERVRKLWQELSDLEKIEDSRALLAEERLELERV